MKKERNKTEVKINEEPERPEKRGKKNESEGKIEEK